MILGTLAATLLEKALADREVIQAVERVIRAGQDY